MDLSSLILVIVVGAAMALQSPMNAALLRTVGVAGSTAACYVIAALLSLVLVFAAGRAGDSVSWWSALRDTPWWGWLGGLMAVVIVPGLAFSVSRVGVSTTILLTLVAQLAMAMTIDHFGLLGVERVAISPAKAGAVVLAVGAVLLTRVP